MPSAFYTFLGFSNFNKKQALGTLEQSSLAIYALFLAMVLFKRKSNSTRLTGKLTKELIMNKQKLRPGLSGLSLPLQYTAYKAAFKATQSPALLSLAVDTAIELENEAYYANSNPQATPCSE